MTRAQQDALALIMQGAEQLGWTIAIGGEADSQEPIPYLIVGEDSKVEIIIGMIEAARGGVKRGDLN